jgi:hypothetical protein
MILIEDTQDIDNLINFLNSSVLKLRKIIESNPNNRILKKYLIHYQNFQKNILLPWIEEYSINQIETPKELENNIKNLLLDYYNLIKYFLK